ncbi:MAG: Bug family tripartite tricarboxylate transporter substrate binding protein [Xanthobacteraceae bacterium]
MQRIAMRLALCVAALVCGASFAQAQGFPTKPVRIVVPYPAGGSVDIVTRAVAQRLNTIWGQPIVIENKAGGGTQIGAEAVAKSAPDGTTLFATGMETFTVTPFMHAKLSYDPDKDFTPVSGLGASNQFLVVPASSDLKSVRDLIARAKAKPGDLQYGTIGLGGSSHINMVLFESMAGVKLTPIHFRGGAPLVTDLLGGHVPMSFLSGALVDQDIRAGKLRPIAIASNQRLPQYPDVPTVAESGVPDFEAVSWYGLWAPSGTPPEIVARINADVQKVFADTDFREKFLEPNFLGSITGNADEFAAYIKAEAGKWSKVIKDATIKVD